MITISVFNIKGVVARITLMNKKNYLKLLLSVKFRFKDHADGLIY